MKTISKNNIKNLIYVAELAGCWSLFSFSSMYFLTSEELFFRNSLRVRRRDFSSQPGVDHLVSLLSSLMITSVQVVHKKIPPFFLFLQYLTQLLSMYQSENPKSLSTCRWDILLLHFFALQ